jgi:cobalt/nickel transport system permease protein
VGAGHTHPLFVHEHSPVHHLPSQAKVVATFSLAALVATTPREDVVAFAGLALLLLGWARLARVPLRFLLPRLAVVTPFLLAALLLPFVASGPRVEVLGVRVAVEGLWGGFGIASRALLGATAALLLVATTEVPDLLRGLERLRVPPVLTQIAAFMVRYLEVIAGEVGRQRRAMTARGYDPRWLWQLRALTAGLGVLFIRSYERGERVHAAMLARGFDGRIPAVAGERVASGRDWALALALPAIGGLIRLITTLLAMTGGPLA